jgi:hypothetical protein
MKAHYRPTELDDVKYVAEHLSKEDQDELYASLGMSNYSALSWSFAVSVECNSIIMPDGTVGGIFGVSSPHKGTGCPWLMGTDRIPEISMTFLKQSKKWVEEQNKKYPLLMNYVDVRNQRAIEWLKFLGFTFIKRVEKHGHGEKPFFQFVRIDECVTQ